MTFSFAVALTGCGSGSIPIPGNSATGSSSTATEAPVTATASTLKLALTDSAGKSISSISNTVPGTIKATLRDASGAVIPNTTVTISTDKTIASISAETVITDASGVATITINPASAASAGAITVTATAQVASQAIVGSLSLAVGSASVALTAPVMGVGTTALSAYGTTSVEVTVSVGGIPVTTPQNVTFSSFCSNLGKAIISTAVTGAGGVARGSYRDNGCAGTDSITASSSGATSTATSLVVTPPSIGSIQFVSVSPSVLSLRGIGGVESSSVIFKVVDTNGNPIIGKTVTFLLSTTLGGISLTPSTGGVATAASDASGLVRVTVNSGTVSTPVRVTASTTDTSVSPPNILTTQSSGLTISTGVPDQDSFTLGATILNLENIVGNSTVLTARLADHFNNPVPDGTAVSFITEGGSIVATCSTVIDASGNSNCSATLTVQEPRLAVDGRYTVLAYAIGEESFTDLNSNGVADLVPNELIDENGVSTDLGEAFRDDNEDGVYDPTREIFLDFNGNGTLDGPDGKYSGVLCNSSISSTGTCSSNKTLHIRRSIVLIFSESNAVITRTSPAGTIDLVGLCSGTSRQVDLRIVDTRGNPLPAGTKIALATTNGTIAEPTSITQASTNITPSAGAANYSVSIRDDSGLVTNPVTGGTSCEDPNPAGVLTVTVTTPGTATIPGIVTTAQFNVIN